MKKTVYLDEFVDSFDRCNRSNNFSVQGRAALFEYLEQLEDDLGEEIELDVIALCCEYSEYESAVEAARDYCGQDIPDGEEDDAMRYLEYHTTVIPFEGGVIIACF